VAGMGIAYLPRFIVEHAVARGDLQTVLDEFVTEPLALSAVYPQHRQTSRPVQVLVEFLREQLGNL
jgi:DNA-binding transcriptional LysR family regulator